jgi:hypothetical protein
MQKGEITCRHQAMVQGGRRGHLYAKEHYHRIRERYEGRAVEEATGRGTDAETVPARWHPVFCKAFVRGAWATAKHTREREASTGAVTVTAKVTDEWCTSAKKPSKKKRGPIVP